MSRAAPLLCQVQALAVHAICQGVDCSDADLDAVAETLADVHALISRELARRQSVRRAHLARVVSLHPSSSVLNPERS